MTTQAELIAAVAKDAGVSQADAGKVLYGMFVLLV